MHGAATETLLSSHEQISAVSVSPCIRRGLAKRFVRVLSGELRCSHHYLWQKAPSIFSHRCRSTSCTAGGGGGGGDVIHLLFVYSATPPGPQIKAITRRRRRIIVGFVSHNSLSVTWLLCYCDAADGGWKVVRWEGGRERKAGRCWRGVAAQKSRLLQWGKENRWKSDYAFTQRSCEPSDGTVLSHPSCARLNWTFRRLWLRREPENVNYTIQRGRSCSLFNRFRNKSQMLKKRKASLSWKCISCHMIVFYNAASRWSELGDEWRGGYILIIFE